MQLGCLALERASQIQREFIGPRGSQCPDAASLHDICDGKVVDRGQDMDRLAGSAVFGRPLVPAPLDTGAIVAVPDFAPAVAVLTPTDSCVLLVSPGTRPLKRTTVRRNTGRRAPDRAVEPL